MCISEELILKAEAKEQASLKAEDEARFYEESRLKAEKEYHARLKVGEEMRLADELRLKAEAGGFCYAGVER